MCTGEPVPTGALAGETVGALNALHMQGHKGLKAGDQTLGELGPWLKFLAPDATLPPDLVTLAGEEPVDAEGFPGSHHKCPRALVNREGDREGGEIDNHAIDLHRLIALSRGLVSP